MIGYIFETTCTVNGKKFIGKNLSVKFDPRELGDNDELRADIAGYGYNKFTCKMIMPYDTEKALDAAEKYFIENASGELYNKATSVDEARPKKARKKKEEE